MTEEPRTDQPQEAPQEPTQEPTPDPVPPQEEKAFSQRDVNRIVNKRLAEERNKAEALFAQRERDLIHKELRLEAADTLRQRKLPATLVALLDYENRERCMASLEGLEADFQAAVREGIHQALRGLGPPKAGAARHDPGADVRGAMGLRHKEDASPL